MKRNCLYVHVYVCAKSRALEIHKISNMHLYNLHVHVSHVVGWEMKRQGGGGGEGGEREHDQETDQCGKQNEE
jgi:hypothetical protein